jgi:hypothetical protein
MKLEFPEISAGIHPPTAALMKILLAKKISNPITNQPYTEALLFGIGGGIGLGYILFQFKHLPNPILVLGFRNQWNNAQAFLETLTDRLFLQVHFQEFEKNEKARQELEQAVNRQQPVIVWVDKAHLPYRQLPADLKGFISHQVTVYGHDERSSHWHLDDLSIHLIEIREKTLSIARENTSPQNYRMMTFINAESFSVQELRASIIDGIKDCAAQLTQTQPNLGINNLDIWANQLTDQVGFTGWPHLFKDHRSPYLVLRTAYESIKLNGADGFALRKMYAEFLQEAAGMLSNYALNAVAGQYLQLANHWSNLADNTLPSRIPVFDRVKNLLKKKYETYKNHDFVQHHQISNDLSFLEEEINSEFPMDANEVIQLFNRLASQIKLIAELEKSAAHRLREVTH